MSPIMLKHVFAQSIYQLIVLIFLVFKGEQYLPSTVQSQSINGELYLFHISILTVIGHVISGRFYDFKTGKPDYDLEGMNNEPSIHFTYIFNIFVMFQIFNFINARKIKDECNIFEGISRSKLFLIILSIIIVLQFILVTFCYRAFNVSKGGLEL